MTHLCYGLAVIAAVVGLWCWHRAVQLATREDWTEEGNRPRW